MFGLDWILSGLSLFAIWGLGQKIRMAWILMAVLGLDWSIYFAGTKQYGLVMFELVSIVIALRSYMKWTK